MKTKRHAPRGAGTPLCGGFGARSGCPLTRAALPPARSARVPHRGKRLRTRKPCLKARNTPRLSITDTVLHRSKARTARRHKNKNLTTLNFPIGFNPIKRGMNMRTTQQFSITLPNEMANVVKAKVQTGEYATESEVIREGLRALIARDRAVESWLHNQVGPAYDALKADPSRAVTTDHIRARLAAEHAFQSAAAQSGD